ncbi:hypothetical protein EV421DRAFT_1907225 [Armillaria borealis]|uniref:Uncharacterized protein n=1 Tax=Armillaria borealis TaxID=47425 RepID=A0AA39J7A9_9AGAR|nr:hypothetical protein EV421DRAFT_1907225 [Armillaria borealis]
MPISPNISNLVFCLVIALIGVITGGITIFLLFHCYSYKLHSWSACYTPLYPSYRSAVPQHPISLPQYPIPHSGPLSTHYISVQPQNTIFPTQPTYPHPYLHPQHNVTNTFDDLMSQASLSSTSLYQQMEETKVKQTLLGEYQEIPAVIETATNSANPNTASDESSIHAWDSQALMEWDLTETLPYIVISDDKEEYPPPSFLY